MKSIHRATLLLIIALLELTGSSNISATPNPDRQSGEIIQEQEANQQDSYSATQDQVIRYFQELATTMRSAASGAAPTPIPLLNENALTYLNSVYLYCSVNNGTCPTMLDALLEVEIINARLSNKAECPNLKQFWRLWIKNQMEERHNFAVKTAFLNPTNEFKRSKRPRYIKCESTVASEVAGQGATPEYFKQRYASGSNQIVSVEQTLQMLEQIRRDVPDIFSAVRPE